MANENDVVNLYRDWLRERISDRNNDRSKLGKEWIYKGIPRADLGGNQYPRIGIQHEDPIDAEPHEINSFDDRATIRVGVYIFVRKDQKIDGLEDEDMIADIAQDVRDAILTTEFETECRTINAFNNFLVSENIRRGKVLVKKMTFRVSQRR